MKDIKQIATEWEILKMSPAASTAAVVLFAARYMDLLISTALDCVKAKIQRDEMLEPDLYLVAGTGKWVDWEQAVDGMKPGEVRAVGRAHRLKDSNLVGTESDDQVIEVDDLSEAEDVAIVACERARKAAAQ